MDQQALSQINRKAWSFAGYYDAWCRYYGSPRALAEDFRGDPWLPLKRYRRHLGEVRGKRIANLLGSIGRKAVPLAQLGACVTVIDISEVNARYARELARCVGVEFEYIVGDVLEINLQPLAGRFDMVFMEGGVLHYFLDLCRFAEIVHTLLQPGGRMILGDFHPIRKCVQVVEDRARLEGDYFDRATHRGNLPLVNFLPIIDQLTFPKTEVRHWTLGEIITAFARTGLVIEELEETPNATRVDIPEMFHLVAYKPVVPGQA